MKVSNLFTLLLLALSATITSACSSESPSHEIEALAFRSSESGRWGIVSMDGEVIRQRLLQERTYCRYGWQIFRKK